MPSELAVSLQYQDLAAIRTWVGSVAEVAPDYSAFKQTLSLHGRVLPRHERDHGEHLWFAPGNSAKWVELDEYGEAYFKPQCGRKVTACGMTA